MLTHVLYIDDSGTKEYGDPAEYQKTRGKTRHFVFCGTLLTMKEASQLSQRIIDLKLARFGDDSVEIKSNWLRIPQERQQRYLDRYQITGAELDAFVEDYHVTFEAAQLDFIAAVVDKLHTQEDYGANPWYAPAIAYELLLQRVQQHVAKGDSVAVIIDDMSGATPKGNQYKQNLKAQHARLKQFGGKLKAGDFPCLATQTFANSASSHILQVSDLAAYNVHRQFRDHGDEWEQHQQNLGVYPPFYRIAKKFRTDGNGRIQGYGIVKFPLRNRVQWMLKAG
jgi:hypothetical protein